MYVISLTVAMLLNMGLGFYVAKCIDDMEQEAREQKKTAPEPEQGSSSRTISCGFWRNLQVTD